MSSYLRRMVLPVDREPSRAQILTQLAIVGGSYYLAARLSLQISLVGGVVTPISPPTGIALVALLGLRLPRRSTWLGAVEAAMVIGGLAAVAYFVFRHQSQDAYLVFPLLIWAAVRFRQLGAAVGAITVVGMATWAAIDEVGPFEN